MKPSSFRLRLVLLILLLAGGPTAIHAQPQPGVICVATFADVNGNGGQDANETPLAGVNVNLATGGVIIATHITAEGEDRYCFEHLLAGLYTITFTDSPLFRATTASEGTFALEDGQQLTVNSFGAFPIPLNNLRAEVATQNATAEEPMDVSTRLMISTAGSMLVMLFMIGVGAVILGMRSNRRRKPARAPKKSGKARQTRDDIQPPSHIRPPLS